MTLEDDLIALEVRVLKDAAGDFLAAVEELRMMLAAGATDLQRKLINLAIPEVEAAARAGVAEGFRLGGANSIDAVQAAPAISPNSVSDARLRLDTIPGKLTDPLQGLDIQLQDAKSAALSLLGAGGQVDEVLSPIFKAANSTTAKVSTQINAAANEAALLVGEAVDQPMVWVAERDACVYCLGLAGKVVRKAGDDFPRADLYADGKTAEAVVQRPALHPHCRCLVEVLADQSYAVALEREAQRSILRGFSLRSESQAVRVRAAARLLGRDPVAPKSVKEYAARAVKAGRFPRGRDVPEGGPRLIVN